MTEGPKILALAPQGLQEDLDTTKMPDKSSEETGEDPAKAEDS